MACVICAFLLLPAIIWFTLRFSAKQAALSSVEIAGMLGYVALCGWVLLRDQAQQTLSLLLIPSWLICEWSIAVDNRIGSDVYFGRFLFVWAEARTVTQR